MKLSRLLYIIALFAGLAGVCLINPIFLALAVATGLTARAASQGRFGPRWD